MSKLTFVNILTGDKLVAVLVMKVTLYASSDLRLVHSALRKEIDQWLKLMKHLLTLFFSNNTESLECAGDHVNCHCVWVSHSMVCVTSTIAKNTAKYGLPALSDFLGRIQNVEKNKRKKLLTPKENMWAFLC